MKLLDGKAALITGASGRMGKAIALQFAEHGAFAGINYFRRKLEAGKD